MDTFAIKAANVASIHFAATELGNPVPLNDTVMPAVLMRDRLQWERRTLNMSYIQESFLRLIIIIPIKSILILVIKSAEGLTSPWHTWTKLPALDYYSCRCQSIRWSIGRGRG
jgi:hypothetical protein